jgi:hypothetical protein
MEALNSGQPINNNNNNNNQINPVPAETLQSPQQPTASINSNQNLNNQHLASNNIAPVPASIPNDAPNTNNKSNSINNNNNNIDNNNNNNNNSGPNQVPSPQVINDTNKVSGNTSASDNSNNNSNSPKSNLLLPVGNVSDAKADGSKIAPEKSGSDPPMQPNEKVGAAFYCRLPDCRHHQNVTITY